MSDERDLLTERLENHRAHLRAVAYRMLGSPNEADDAVQEAWLRLSRAGADGIDNIADGYFSHRRLMTSRSLLSASAEQGS